MVRIWVHKENYPGLLKAECCSRVVCNLILMLANLSFDLWEK